MVMNARCQLLTASSVKMADFWDVVPCCLVDMWKEAVMEYVKGPFPAFT
jgi:hypothetical protein